MYSYIRKNEMEELILNKRYAFVITDLFTKDIEECITAYLSMLNEIGINRGILNQPKIQRKKNGEYIILLVIRNSIKIDENLKNNISTLLKIHKNIFSVKDYVQHQYKNVSTTEKVKDNIKVKIKFKSLMNNTIKQANLRLIIQNNIILKTILDLGDGVRLLADVIDCNNNIESIIAKSVRPAYQNYSLNIYKVYIQMNNKSYHYNVEPTCNSIRLVLIK